MGRWLQTQEGELPVLRKATGRLTRRRWTGVLGAAPVQICLQDPLPSGLVVSERGPEWRQKLQSQKAAPSLWGQGDTRAEGLRQRPG